MTKQKEKTCENCRFFVTLYNPGTVPGSDSDIHRCLKTAKTDSSNQGCKQWKGWKRNNTDQESFIARYCREEEKKMRVDDCYKDITHTKNGTWLTESTANSDHVPPLEKRKWWCEEHRSREFGLRQKLNVERLELPCNVRCEECHKFLSGEAWTEAY